MESLVVSIITHPVFGEVLQALLVEGDIAASVSVLEVLTPASTAYPRLNEEEQKIVRLCEKYADKNLMKLYSKEKTTVDFYKKLSPETIERYIRPTIEKSHQRVLDIIYTSDIPLFFRQNTKRRVLYADTDKILCDKNVAKVVFNFRKEDGAGLQYSIRVKWKDTEIDLNGTSYIILSNEPAIVMVDNKLLVFNDIDARKLLPFFNKTHIPIPTSSEKAYIEKFVVNCVKNYEVKTTGLQIEEITPQKRCALSLVNNWENIAVLQLQFYYNNKFYASDSSKNKVVFTEEQPNGSIVIKWFYRDMEWEKAQENLLVQNGLEKVGITDFRPQNASDATQKMQGIIEWIRTHSELLKSFDFAQKIANQTYYLGEISLKMVIGEKPDWFDVKCMVVFGHFEIPFIRFKNHIINNMEEYILPDGSVAILPCEWFDKYNELMLFGKKDGEVIRLKKHHFRIIENVEENQEKSPVSALNHFEIQAVPDEIKVDLRPYQQKGFSWLVHLYENKFGACLADDMGLGKTLQAICLLQYIANKRKAATIEQPEETNTGETGQLSLFDSNNEPSPPLSFDISDIPPSLIAVPTSLMHNWRNELKRFAPTLKVYPYSGAKRWRTKEIAKIFRHYDIVLTTYGILRNDVDIFSAIPFDHLILDESQYVKNPDSQIFKAIQQINASTRLALTGTPIENSLTDLWAQFELLNEGLLGNYSSFRNAYIHPISRDNKEKEKALLNIIQPFILRRAKSDVALELPELSEETIYCDMSEQQQKQYNAEKNKIRNSITSSDTMDIRKMAFATLQGLTRLRLLANHPVFVEEDYTDSSGKFEQVTMYLQTLKSEGHKVLIFSSFVKQLRLYCDFVRQKEWKYAWLTGTTKPNDREHEIEKFMQQKDVHFFFVSLKAGGVGLNLTAADYVFILDPWWNPAAEEQAIKRAYRIGQQNNVMAYRFISSATIEEKIRSLQESKSKLADTFIKSNNPLALMTKEDIEKLLD